MKIRYIACVILVLTALTVQQAAYACPLCSEAVASSNDGSPDQETNDFPAAMNQSIYLMIGVPYTALAIVGFLIYRGVKQNAAYIKDIQQASSPV